MGVIRVSQPVFDAGEPVDARRDGLWRITWSRRERLPTVSAMGGEGIPCGSRCPGLKPPGWQGKPADGVWRSILVFPPPVPARLSSWAEPAGAERRAAERRISRRSGHAAGRSFAAPGPAGRRPRRRSGWQRGGADGCRIYRI